MTPETPYFQPTAPVHASSPHPDRSGWLIAFGIVQICFGAIFFLIALSTAFSAIKHGSNPVAFVLYLMLACLWGVLGIGSVMKQDWARAGIVAVSWVWLLVDAAILAFFIGFGKDILVESQKNSQSEMIYSVIGLIVVVGLVAIFLGIPPAIMAFFYSRPSVRATCVARMPSRPLLVNVLATWQWFAAAATLISLFVTKVMPIFGSRVGLVPAKAILAFGLVMHLFAAWKLLRVEVAGWWAALAYSAFWVVSSTVTYALRNPLELYRSMGSGQAQIDFIQRHPLFFTLIMTSSLFTHFLGVLLLLWARQYFVPNPPRSSFSESISTAADSNPV